MAVQKILNLGDQQDMISHAVEYNMLSVAKQVNILKLNEREYFVWLMSISKGKLPPTRQGLNHLLFLRRVLSR